MNDESLQHELFLLVGYLLTSAHGLYGEPAGYGPFRLIDAAGRLLEIMRTSSVREAGGPADPYLSRLEVTIQAERFGSKGDQELRDVLNKLCLEYATELRTRQVGPGRIEEDQG